MFALAMLEKDINSNSQQGAGETLMDITKDAGRARAEWSNELLCFDMCMVAVCMWPKSTDLSSRTTEKWLVFMQSLAHQIL
jgi:hypothetical protein